MSEPIIEERSQGIRLALSEDRGDSMLLVCVYCGARHWAAPEALDETFNCHACGYVNILHPLDGGAL